VFHGKPRIECEECNEPENVTEYFVAYPISQTPPAKPQLEISPCHVATPPPAPPPA
jgi:hypothetical protein